MLSEFERLFTRWLHIKADLEADVRVMGEQPDAQMLSERLLEVQKELTQLLDKPRAELINLSPIEQANLQRMGYALALLAYAVRGATFGGRKSSSERELVA